MPPDINTCRKRRVGLPDGTPLAARTNAITRLEEQHEAEEAASNGDTARLLLTELHYAAYEGSVKEIERLLSAGVPVDQRNAFGSTL